MTNNQAKAQEYWQAARHELMQLMRTGSSTTGPGFQQQWGAYGDRTSPAGGFAGLMNFRHGTMPQPADVDRFIEQMGGNPYTKKAGQNARGKGGKKSESNTAAGMRLSQRQLDEESPATLLRRIAADYQTKIDEANAANEKRYGEGKGELTDLRTRRQERAANSGISQKADITERMDESLDEQKAYLAERGLLNSNVFPAWQERNDRDKAKEIQRVSEWVSDRENQFDAQDTNNLVGFIERRDDIAPDPAQFYAIAERLGTQQALADAEVKREQMYQPDRQAPQIPYYPSYSSGAVSGQQYQQMVQGAFGGGGGGYQQQGGYGPQDFYEQYAPQDDGWPDMSKPPGDVRRANEEAAKLERIAKRRAAQAAGNLQNIPYAQRQKIGFGDLWRK